MGIDFDNAAQARPRPAAVSRRRNKSRRGPLRFFRPRVEQLESRQMLAADLVWIDEPTEMGTDDKAVVEEVATSCDGETAKEQVAVDTKKDLQQDGQRAESSLRDEPDSIDFTARSCDIEFILSASSDSAFERDSVSRAGVANGFEMSLAPTDEDTKAAAPSDSDSIDIAPFAARVVVVPYSSAANSAVVTQGTPANLTPRAYQPVTPAPGSEEADRPHYFATQQSLGAARWQVGSEPDVGSTNLLDVLGPDDLQGRRVIRLSAAKATKQMAAMTGSARLFSIRSTRPGPGPVTMSAARAEFVSAVFASPQSWLPAPQTAINAKLFPASLWQTVESHTETASPATEVPPKNSAVKPATAAAPAGPNVLGDSAAVAQPVAFVSRSESGAADPIRREES